MRVAHLIRSILAEAMREKLSDPRLDAMISITRVEISPDFSSAHVHVSVMANEARRNLAVQALQSASGKLRSMVAEQISMRTVPWLTFHLDDSLRKGFETVQIIDRVMGEYPDSSVSDDAPPDPVAAPPSNSNNEIPVNRIADDQESNGKDS